jgi:alpha-1,6-mannosyltransferase
MATTSWWLGAVPVRFSRHTPAPVSWLPAHGDPAHLAFYLGLAAMTAAWLVLGRRLLAHDPEVTVRRLRRFVLGSATPFLFAAPFGRDLWAYAAQGNVVGHGLDPYTHGPVAAPGAFTDEVSSRWLNSPAPYGPLWLRLSQLATWLSRHHPTVSALLLRLPAFAALLLCLWALPRLAERLGARPAPAVWLGLASPLTIVLGVGGGHNDLVMIALALAGLAVASQPGMSSLALGAALVGVAVMIKSPAVIAVAFAVPVWLHANSAPCTPRRVLTACGVALVGSAISVGVITAASGLGTGWTHQVNSDAQWVSWLSLPSAAAMIGRLIASGSTAHLGELDHAMRVSRNVGEVLAVALLIALWLAAVSRAGTPARRTAGYLAAAFGTAALFAPSVQPWYYSWGLVFAGLVTLRRPVLLALTTVAIAFPVLIRPSGSGLESVWSAWPIMIGAGLVSWLVLRPGSAADDDGADHAGAEVRADDGAQLGHV